MNVNSIKVDFAQEEHCKYAERIVTLIYESALQRGTGIAKRSPEYIAQKISTGKAVVALDGDKLIGFSYIESWDVMVTMLALRALLLTLTTDTWA